MIQYNFKWFLIAFASLLLASCSDGDDETSSTPSLDPRFSVSTDPINFGELTIDTSVVKTLGITARDLSQDVKIATSGTGFSLSPSEDGTYDSTLMITASSLNGNEVKVYAKFTGTSIGEFSGKLLITSELGINEVELKAKVVEITVVKNIQWKEDFDFSGKTEMVALPERFDTTTTALANTSDWVSLKGGGNLPLVDGLKFEGYPGSGIGSALGMSGGETINYARTLVDHPTDSLEEIYVSFLFSATSAATKGSHPVVFGEWQEKAAPGANFQTKFILRDVDGAIKFGVTTGGAGFNAANTAMADKPINSGQIYLVVMKLHTKGENGFDKASLYILDALTDQEPTNADAVSVAVSNKNVNLLVIQQKGADNESIVDGVRIANTWSDLF